MEAAKTKSPAAKKPGKPKPETVVRKFIEALERLDLDAAMELCDPEITYQNVPLRPSRGIESTRSLLAKMFRPATRFEVEMHNLAVDGDTVLTERTDYFEAGRLRADFWVCGTFEVRDGKITLWRDRFDWADFTFSLAKGGVLAGVSALRARLAR